MLAAALWAGDGAAISHRAAGELWRMDAVPSGFVEISTERRLGAEGVISHRMRVEPEQIVHTRSIPATDPTRTLLDLGACMTIKDLERAVESALRRGLTDLSLIEQRLQARGRRGRNGTKAWRELLQARIPTLAPTESDFETLMAQLLRSFGLPEPIRQLRIRNNGRIVKRADFAYPHEMVVIEADGVDPHLNTQQWRRDRQQQNLLHLMGWVVLRFTRREVVETPADVAGTIRGTLEERRVLLSVERFPL